MQLRAVTLGVLGGLGTALLLLGIVAVLGAIAAAAGAVAFDIVLPATRVVAVIAAGVVGGGIAGSFAPLVRSPVGAALVGAVVTIAANAVIAALDPAADSWPTSPSRFDKFILVLISGIPGLVAPLLWAPVRSAASHSTVRAAAEIAVRVGAFVLALYAALISAPLLFFGGLSVISGLVMVPRMDGLLLRGLGYVGAALALGATSVLCLWIAKIPRGRGPLPGFEEPPGTR